MAEAQTRCLTDRNREAGANIRAKRRFDFSGFHRYPKTLGLEARNRDLLWMGKIKFSPLPKPRDEDWENNIGLRQSHKGGHMKQADAQTELHEAHFIVPIGNSQRCSKLLRPSQRTQTRPHC